MLSACLRIANWGWVLVVLGGLTVLSGCEPKKPETSSETSSSENSSSEKGDPKSAPPVEKVDGGADPKDPATGHLDESTPVPGAEVEIALDLPAPAFKGTPKHVPEGSHLEEPRRGPRPPFKAPAGTKNLAFEKPVSGSDEDPIIGSLDLITDGDKQATEESYVEFGPGPQYVQIDLGQPAELHGILLWQYHNNARVYHDVVVQLSDDADFVLGVTTVYNNDHDNSSSLGVGADKEYWESFEGRLFEFEPISARYVRISSNGSTEDDQNHHTEIEVYGVSQ